MAFLGYIGKSITLGISKFFRENLLRRPAKMRELFTLMLGTLLKQKHISSFSLLTKSATVSPTAH